MITLDDLSKEQLKELVHVYARNFLAIDGVWFQSIEQKYGMAEAMYHDCEAWKRYSVSEARRLKKFLHLDEHPGLEGLRQAFEFRFSAFVNPAIEYELRADELIFRVSTVRSSPRANAKACPCIPACRSGRSNIPILPARSTIESNVKSSAAIRRSPIRRAPASGGSLSVPKNRAIPYPRPLLSATWNVPRIIGLHGSRRVARDAAKVPPPKRKEATGYPVASFGVASLRLELRTS